MYRLRKFGAYINLAPFLTRTPYKRNHLNAHLFGIKFSKGLVSFETTVAHEIIEREVNKELTETLD